jgi:Fic/DOC family
VRYLSLAEALAVAEAVTGIEVAVHARGSRINLLDSALHAPQASFSGHDMYPEFLDQAAVLAVRISRNHPLLDGNKRLWTKLGWPDGSPCGSIKKTEDMRPRPAVRGDPGRVGG